MVEDKTLTLSLRWFIPDEVTQKNRPCIQYKDRIFVLTSSKPVAMPFIELESQKRQFLTYPTHTSGKVGKITGSISLPESSILILIKQMEVASNVKS